MATILKVLITGWLLLGLASMCRAGDLYVMATGNDANDGSAMDAGHAKLTIQGALDAAVASTTIHINAGTWNITGYLYADDTNTGNLTIQPYQSGSVIINFQHDYLCFRIAAAYVADGTITFQNGSGSLVMKTEDTGTTSKIIEILGDGDVVVDCTVGESSGTTGYYGVYADNSSTASAITIADEGVVYGRVYGLGLLSCQALTLAAGATVMCSATSGNGYAISLGGGCGDVTIGAAKIGAIITGY